MAGWTDSSATRRARGGAGGFTSRGGANTSNTRWRERRPPPHHQPHHQPQRHHPVNHHSPSSEGQGASSTATSTRRPQPPLTPRPTFKSPPTPANSNSNSNSNDPDDKARRNAANFECNVCFDMAADPVVTKCGHLFCWECLYQWLHVHSHHRECPVCKGQVADDAIIPIYGRGGSAASVPSVHAAPPRPTGARVESSRQQQPTADWHMDDEDEDDPFDLQEIRLGFGVSSLRDAMMSFMPDDHGEMEQHFDDYTNPFDIDVDDFDEVHHYDLLGFPVFPSAGAGAGAGPSRGHGHHSLVSDDIMDTFFNNAITTPQDPDFGYRGGRRQRGRARGAAAAPADHSNIVGRVMGSSLMMGGSGASYRESAAGPHITTGNSSRPNAGWTERRGRSNRNSNSGGGRGMQNSRRHGTNYN